MTKQHFIAFANDIARLVAIANKYQPPHNSISMEIAQAQAEMVCRVALKFNPQFDKSRFKKACGLTD